VPLVAGIATGHRAEATVVALGALWAISQDGLDAWAGRSRRLLAVSATSGIGFALGAAVGAVTHQSLAVDAALAVVALVAGLVEGSGMAAAGMCLLVGFIVGGGLQVLGTSWRAAPLVVLGGLWVWTLAALTDRRSRRATERDAIAEGLDSLAICLREVGSPRFSAARHAAVRSLDRAQDAVGTRPPQVGDPEDLAIAQSLAVSLRCGELVSYLAGTGAPPAPQVADVLAQAAVELRQGSAARAVALLGRFADGPGGVSGRPGLQAVAPPAAEELRSVEPYPPTRMAIPPIERLRFAVVLSAAVTVAAVVARALDGPHGFWLPLAVAFILRPDVGPVMRRALARTAGTLLGALIALAVSAAGDSALLVIVLSCLMAAALPWASRRSHVLTVMVFTPIVFVFLSVIGPDQYLFVPRVVDTALGAAIVLVTDLVFWSTAPSLRVGAQLARARTAVAAYARCTADTPADLRHRRRRSAWRALTDARAAEELARKEPVPWRRPGPEVRASLDRLGAAIDQHTVSVVRERARRVTPGSSPRRGG
jgi:hypothetical protein